MYQMTPIFYESDEDMARYTDTLAKGVLLVVGLVAAVALALVLLAAVSAGSLRMIEWCSEELSEFSCRLYLSGI